MANEFKLTEDTRQDLKEIWIYIAEFSPNSADKKLREFKEKFQLVASNPKIGRSHDNLIINLRSFPHKDHIIFYFQVENGVEIYRILHGARNIEDLFENYFEGLKP